MAQENAKQVGATLIAGVRSSELQHYLRLFYEPTGIMVSCNLYDARVVAKRLVGNMADEESVFLQGIYLKLLFKHFLEFVLILFAVSVIQAFILSNFLQNT